MSIQHSTRRLARSPCLRCLYSTSTTPPAAPLLLKLRGDLKTAMKAKDTNRLNVLRMLLAEITNASKTASPINNDMQVLALLRKRSAAAKAAADEFAAANRSDLKDKEEAQVAVMEEYAGVVQTVSDEEVRKAVEELKKETAAGEKVDKGKFLRKLIGPGGVFEGKPVEKASVVRIVQEVLG